MSLGNAPMKTRAIFLINILYGQDGFKIEDAVSEMLDHNLIGKKEGVEDATTSLDGVKIFTDNSNLKAALSAHINGAKQGTKQVAQFHAPTQSWYLSPKQVQKFLIGEDLPEPNAWCKKYKVSKVILNSYKPEPRC